MPCIAYEELTDAVWYLTENFPPHPIEPPPATRLEWMLRRHNSDGSDGCDWCLMAEEIRRLRSQLENNTPLALDV